MFRYIVKALGLNHLPTQLLLHLLVLAFFTGGFAGWWFITAFSDVLDNDCLKYFPQIVMGWGVLSLLFFMLFKSANYRLSVIIFISVCFVLLMTVLIAGYLSMGVFKSVLLATLWLPVSSISEQYVLRAGQQVEKHPNLSRFLELGFTLGGMCFSFFAFVLGLTHNSFSFHWFLVAGLVAIALYAMIFFVRHIPFEVSNENIDLQSFSKAGKDSARSILLPLLFFILISITVYIFVEYTFLAMLEKYYDNRFEVIKLLAFVFCGTVGARLFFKLFVYQNLIKSFRIGFALLLAPLVVLVLLVVMEGILLINPTQTIRHFPPIFLALLLGRFFIYLVNESFGYFSTNLLLAATEIYREKKFRDLYHSTLWWGMAGSGALLFLLPAGSLIYHFSLFLSAIWLGVAYLVLKNYKLVIEKIIAKFSDLFKKYTSESAFIPDEKFVTGPFLLWEELAKKYHPALLKKMNLNENIGIPSNGIDHSKDISELATSVNPKERMEALRLIGQKEGAESVTLVRILLRDDDDMVRRAAISCPLLTKNTELLKEVSHFLLNNQYRHLASEALANGGWRSVPLLTHLFDQSSTPTSVQRHIIETISQISGEAVGNFLISKLVYPNKTLVFDIARLLLEKKDEYPLAQNPIIDVAIRNTTNVAAWLLAMDVSISNIPAEDPLKMALKAEYNQTLEGLFFLLQLRYNDGLIQLAREHMVNNSDNEKREVCIDILARVIDPETAQFLFPLLHNNQPREKVMQLSHIFPVELKKPVEALNDILLADATHVETWTKACALNVLISTYKLGLTEDIVALAFHPEKLLYELALYGIYKEQKTFSSELTQRLPAENAKAAERISAMGDDTSLALLFFKNIALLDTEAFGNLAGTDLLPLASILEQSPISTCLWFEPSLGLLPLLIVPKAPLWHARFGRKTMALPFGACGLEQTEMPLEIYADQPSVVLSAVPEKMLNLTFDNNALTKAIFDIMGKPIINH